MEDNYSELLNILMGTNSIEIDDHYFWMIGFIYSSILDGLDKVRPTSQKVDVRFMVILLAYSFW